MRHGLLCLSLLSGCTFLSPSHETDIHEYALTWYCVSPEGCERMDEVERIDLVSIDDYAFHFTSTMDESFSEDAQRIASDSLSVGCSWLYFLSLFGHTLERSKFCRTPGGFEIEVSIPNEDPTTHSKWVVSGRDIDLL